MALSADHMRRIEREARVVEKPFVTLMPHKQYNSSERCSTCWAALALQTAQQVANTFTPDT